jgi:gas vesicle protein
MKNASAKLGFFIAGVGLGAVVAVLYTPKSGKETRKLIAQKSEEGREYLEARGRVLRRHAEDTVDRTKEFVTKQKDRLAEALRAS